MQQALTSSGILVLFVAATLHAQTMSEEVAALHRAIFERGPDHEFRDVAASSDLALRYLEGRGVPQDELIACGLLFLTDHAVATLPARDELLTSAPRRFFEERCGGRSEPEELEALVNASCGMFGPNPQVAWLEPGSWLEIGPKGLIIDRPAGRTRHPLPATCGTQYVLARYIAMALGSGDAPARHFVEFLMWKSGHGAKGLQRHLEWGLFEVIGSEFENRAFELLVFEPGSQWPTPPVPAPFAGGASLTMARDGAVHWRFDTEPPKAGVIEPGQLQ